MSQYSVSARDTGNVLNYEWFEFLFQYNNKDIFHEYKVLL